MMKFPSFPVSSGELIPIIYDKFIGYNITDNPTSLPPGYLVEDSQNIDLTRSLGALAKRRGIEAQITSLGSGGVKGLHTYRRSSGDRPVLGHGTDCYKLSGASSGITKTTTADFDEGTHTDTRAATDKLILASDNVVGSNWGYEVSGGGTVQLFSGNLIGQTFLTEANQYAIKAISIKCSTSWGAGENVTLNLYAWNTDYATTKASAPLATATINGPIANSVWAQAAFSNPVNVSPNTTYFFELSLNAGSFYLEKHNTYADGTEYKDGVAVAEDLLFRIYSSKYKAEGSWLSPVYDLVSTPATATLVWNVTGSVIFQVKGSSDNQNWGDWESVAASGNGIPLTRYLQIKATLETSDTATTSALEDFTITYETAFTEATSIKSGLTGNRVRFVDYEDKCFFTEGGRPQRFDGTNVRDVGVDAPSSAPTLAANGAGLTGTYKARVTFVNDQGAESNGGTESGSITLSNQGIAWSNIPLGPAGTASRKLYRTKAGGSTYYYVTTLNDNTTTTYTDTTADASLITLLETDNDIPPDATIVYEHKNYMLYVVNDRLYFSKPGLPDSVPVNAYKEFPGPILGVRAYQDAIVIGGDKYTAAVFGNIWDKDPTVDNTTVRIISEAYGPVSHEAMAQAFGPEGDILIFPTRQGLYYLSPGLQENSMRSIPLSRAVQKVFDGAVNINNMAAIYDKNRYILALNYYGTDTPVQTNNLVLVYDLRTGEWSPPWTIPAAGFCIANSKLYCGSPTIGQIYEMDKGTSDAGANINSIAKLSPTTPQGPHVKKKFVQTRVTVTDTSNTSTLQLKPSVDGVSATLTPGIWTASISPKKKIPLPRGYEFQLTIEDDSTNDWVINKIVTEFEGGV